ncbi:hypothetical protein B296_00004453 [Ensete ventricosum]|uniref:Kinesin-like protein n=1 Tax=Ensete ventricosum TaxID=4639 RepID=A0A427AB00_ENSVE|nr:hypothetical protein B296_00004453 [Ensete ventricosum]
MHAEAGDGLCPVSSVERSAAHLCRVIMPVSTRSQISIGRNEPASADHDREGQRARARLLRDPHHGLREKMRALTLLYEQHRSQLASRTVSEEPRVLATHHPSVELAAPSRRRRQQEQEKQGEQDERDPIQKEKANRGLFPMADAAKENQEVWDQNRIAVNSAACPKKAVATAPGVGRAATTGKLSLRELISDGAQSDGWLGRSKVAGDQLGVVAAESREAPGSRILVFVRLRPMAKKEKDAGSRCCVKIVNRKDVYLTEFASETDYLRLKRVRGRHFCFDSSFPDSTPQQEVYATTTADLVEGVLQGRNGSVFCYGATGAGKTYTMLGTVENPGVMVLAIKDLFSKIRQRSYDGDHSVQLSYLEVYNETVRDLLSPGRPLVLREDKQQGNLNRTTEPTRANETSSRSHAILQCNDSGSIVRRIGKLSLIDLAGSERALATDQRTQRSIEGANINRSLLALSSCINALVEGKKHIPFRNSKLTQLLKDSLGGHCNTLQKENSELRQQLVRHQQKMLSIQAQSLAASPAPSIAPSSVLSTPCSTQRKVKRSILSANCFSTPESKNRANDDTVVQGLKKTVKALKDEIEKLKKEHLLQVKQKDDFIRDLITKYGLKPSEGQREKRVGTRSSLRRGEKSAVETGELKSPNHRFTSPVPTAKKRSFWDITTGNSPSVVALNGRKTRSHVAAEAHATPSMLLQVQISK